jgi:very-short-patch-repair endonuclease/transcription elongation GreA/GreB family factor
LINIKEKATRTQFFSDKYKGTLTDIAAALEKDALSFGWYEDEFGDPNHDDLLRGLAEYIRLNEKYKEIETDELEYEIPDPNKLLTVEQLKDYASLQHKLTSLHPADILIKKITSSDFNLLSQRLDQLLLLSNELNKFQADFTSPIIASFNQGRSQEWYLLLNQSKEVIGRLNIEDLKRFDLDIDITYPEGKNLKQLKNDAQILHSYLKSGNTLSGLSFTIKKAFLPKEIKERLYFIEEVRVNGSPCDTIEEYETVLQDISFQQDFKELSLIWKTDIPSGDIRYDKLLFFKKIQEEAEEVLQIIHKANAVKLAIESTSNISIQNFSRDTISKAIEEVTYSDVLEQVSSYKELVREARTYLNRTNLHPIKEVINGLYDTLDHYSYADLLDTLRLTQSRKAQYLAFKKLASELTSQLPNTIRTVLTGDCTLSDIPRLKDAIYFRHAGRMLGKLMDVGYENQLIQELHDLESRERQLIARLASKKAWYTVVERLQLNHSLRQHLEAWVMAVKRIGKTGKGKRAIKFRKTAQQEMEYCKNSVPCWIMPLYKVAETIEPKQEMYDYVIIDEASQLGPDAIFLLYISKNIIIVGDDKQTSPEYIGVDANTMTPHIRRHLEGIPFSDYYGTEFSFFDHAKLFCKGLTVLREHFRCMPEIIEFSNRHFYAPDGKGLYPLKQYSENRLEPLVAMYCPNGYVEGKGSRIINRPEAERIVEAIRNLVQNPKYHAKTIGVITLQGDQQASMIENLLLKEIGEKEFQHHRITCGNSSSFQGDERDIIFLSLVTAQNHNRSALVKAEDERRFNVAVSRAKEQIWLFHSVQLEDLSNTNDLRYKLLDHFKNYNSYQPIHNTKIERRLGSQPEPFDSWFEVDVYNDIVSKNLSITPQYEVAKGRYRIDMVAFLPNGAKIAVECDGDKWHGPDQHKNDMMRQKVLERCGWQFFRVRGYEYYTNREKALEPFWKMVQRLEKSDTIQESEPIYLPSVSLESGKFATTEIQNANSVPVVDEIAPSYSSANVENKIIEKLEPNSRPRVGLEEEKATQTEGQNVDPLSILEIIASQSLTESNEKPEQAISKGSIKARQKPTTTGDKIRYFNLYKSGKYILTDQKLPKADYVVPFKHSSRNGYLLLCYKSGHVNKVGLSVLLSQKAGEENINGFNLHGEIAHIEAIESDRIIGLFFRQEGRIRFKAHFTKNIPESDKIDFWGYKIIYANFDHIQYHIIPLELQPTISRLVFKSFFSMGGSIDDKNYQSEFKIINTLEGAIQAFATEENNVNIPSIPDKSVVMPNDTVKLRMGNGKREFIVKLGNYPSGGNNVVDGVQLIHVEGPLALSILGKKVGEVVKAAGTEFLVEIVEIM